MSITTTACSQMNVKEFDRRRNSRRARNISQRMVRQNQQVRILSLLELDRRTEKVSAYFQNNDKIDPLNLTSKRQMNGLLVILGSESRSGSIDEMMSIFPEIRFKREMKRSSQFGWRMTIE